MSKKKATAAHKNQSHQKMPPKQAQLTKQKSKQTQKSKLNWIIPVALAVVAVIIITVLIINNKAPATTDALSANINVSEAAQRFGDGTYLLDVRTVEEWNESHIGGAVLIPLDELSARINEIPTDRDVLIICRSGNRSAEARDTLRAAGFTRTTSITGGINAWIAEGLPVVTGP